MVQITVQSSVPHHTDYIAMFQILCGKDTNLSQTCKKGTGRRAFPCASLERSAGSCVSAAEVQRGWKLQRLPHWESNCLTCLESWSGQFQAGSRPKTALFTCEFKRKQLLDRCVWTQSFSFNTDVWMKFRTFKLEGKLIWWFVKGLLLTGMLMETGICNRAKNDYSSLFLFVSSPFCVCLYVCCAKYPATIFPMVTEKACKGKGGGKKRGLGKSLT